MEREKLASRMGFILLSAGCAIGIGNVWRFPYITGLYGGGMFVLLYLFFLVAMGVPVMTMEFAVGRASRKSIVKKFHGVRKTGTEMAFERISRHGGKLYSDDVLHDCGRMDAILLLSDADGKIYRKRYAAGSGNVSGDA